MDYHFGHPYYILAKPCGSTCNLQCHYCYFIDKATGRISDALLEHFIKDYIGSQPTENVLFTWHGGEPMLMGLDFYKRIVSLQRQYAGGKHIDNSIQTNGLLLDDQWAKFLSDHHFLVGISIDGPQHLHDTYRKDHAGNGTWQRVMRAIDRMQQHGVEWNAMGTVNHANADHPIEVYRFLKSIGSQYIQVSPIVEQTAGGEMTKESITARQWGNFLCTIFDEWVKTDVGKVFFEIFDAILANWCNVEPGICTFAKHCGLGMAMMPDGNVYSCDHFVSPDYLLGNIAQKPLAEMVFSQRQLAFGYNKNTSLPNDCQQCAYLFACNGGCPKDRLKQQKNYLCEGYKNFFEHVAPAMAFMRDELRAGRAPANIMAVL